MRLSREVGRPSRRRALAAALALVAAASATPAGAIELAVEAPPELAADAIRIRSLEGIDIGSILALTGMSQPGPVIRVILADEHSTLAARAPSWVSGYALGALSTIVLFPARVPSYPDRNLENLVVHELAHILVWRAAGGREVPRWFNEGLATVAAREWALEDRARTALALLGERPHGVAEVDSGFSGDATEAARSYALSAAFVRYLLHEYGEAVAARTLAFVADGDAFTDAFRRATGVTLAAAEEAYFRREALWNTWVPFLTSSTALWIGITALALLAIRGRRRRDAELRARWELEEAAGRTTATAGDSDDDPRQWN